jgi:hypothetical protein
MQDSRILEQTLINSTEGTKVGPLTSVFKKVDWAVVNDQQNGSYINSECVFDTLNLSNSGRFCTYEGGHFAFPICVAAVTPHNGLDLTTAAAVDYVSPKNLLGLNIIQSIQIQRNGKDMVSQVTDINDYLVFRQHEQLSDMDVKLNGEFYGYHKDSTDSIDSGLNSGLEARQETVQNSTVANFALISQAGNSVSFGDNRTGANAGTFRVWHYIAYLPLRFLPGFDSPNLGLEKGAHYRIHIKFNNCKLDIVGAAAGAGTTAPTVTFSGNNTCPIICTETFNTALKAVAAVAPAAAVKNATVTVNVGAASIYAETTDAKMLASKRLNVQMYVPTYVVQNPEVILKMGTKNLKYDHIISSHSEVQALANYENTVVVSQSKIKRLIMLVRKGASYEKSRSCLSCIPGTLGDTHQISDLQVQYGSLNMFENPVQYDWQHWMDVGGKFSNTSNMDGMAGGQLTYADWKRNGYKCYVFDFSRRHVEDVNTGLSVKVSFRNGPDALSLLFFLETEKSIDVDMLTGVRVD